MVEQIKRLRGQLNEQIYDVFGQEIDPKEESYNPKPTKLDISGTKYGRIYGKGKFGGYNTQYGEITPVEIKEIYLETDRLMLVSGFVTDGEEDMNAKLVIDKKRREIVDAERT